MDSKLHRTADLTIISFGAIFFTIIFAKHLLGAIVPILIGALTASFIHPIVSAISKSTRVSAKITSAVLVILVYGTLVTIVFYAVSRLSSEIGNLIDSISKNPENIRRVLSPIVSNFKSILEKNDFLKNIFGVDRSIEISEILMELLSSLLSSVTAFLPSAAVSFASKIPETLLFIAVSIFSAYYLCCDRKKITTAIFSVIPQKNQPRVINLAQKITKALRGCLKAYFSVMILTFFELFVGFSILKIRYAFLLALVVAAIDVLPILGTGTVIIPWALISLTTGDKRLGAGLLILYASITIIRQLVEPKIIGATLGVHPLAAFASTYIAIKLFGISGVVIGTIVATVFSTLKTASVPQTEITD